MKFIEQIRLLERVDQLIRLKATGNPKELASRLEVSERTVYNIMENLRDLGIDLYYCEQRRSYCYNGSFRIQFLIRAVDNREQIVGGEKKVNIFSLLQNFCSDAPHLCTM
jgi:transcriptional antiterminator